MQINEKPLILSLGEGDKSENYKIRLRAMNLWHL